MFSRRWHAQEWACLVAPAPLHPPPAHPPALHALELRLAQPRLAVVQALQIAHRRAAAAQARLKLSLPDCRAGWKTGTAGWIKEC